ncbi:hypothetical protein E2C01_030976 [Portunus trituberculatus]|uniref:Uncharacterized protein n=1 Tax=Portunus trituberculatus TaxID=210409 RepID=A0A5B7EVM7_PORTR|nr:hypothetical protein [Portunus trituberculatus]
MNTIRGDINAGERRANNKTRSRLSVMLHSQWGDQPLPKTPLTSSTYIHPSTTSTSSTSFTCIYPSTPVHSHRLQPLPPELHPHPPIYYLHLLH